MVAETVNGTTPRPAGNYGAGGAGHYNDTLVWDYRGSTPATFVSNAAVGHYFADLMRYYTQGGFHDASGEWHAGTSCIEWSHLLPFFLEGWGGSGLTRRSRWELRIPQQRPKVPPLVAFLWCGW